MDQSKPPYDELLECIFLDIHESIKWLGFLRSAYDAYFDYYLAIFVRDFKKYFKQLFPKFYVLRSTQISGSLNFVHYCYNIDDLAEH